jgi:hypothetical protein
MGVGGKDSVPGSPENNSQFSAQIGGQVYRCYLLVSLFLQYFTFW